MKKVILFKNTVGFIEGDVSTKLTISGDDGKEINVTDIGSKKWEELKKMKDKDIKKELVR